MPKDIYFIEFEKSIINKIIKLTSKSMEENSNYILDVFKSLSLFSKNTLVYLLYKKKILKKFIYLLSKDEIQFLYYIVDPINKLEIKKCVDFLITEVSFSIKSCLNNTFYLDTYLEDILDCLIRSENNISYLFVTDHKDTLLFAIPIFSIIGKKQKTKLKDLEYLGQKLVTHNINDDFDNNTVKKFLSFSARESIPIMLVVDIKLRIIGIICATDIINFINKEWIDDIEMLGGIDLDFNKKVSRDALQRFLGLLPNFIASMGILITTQTVGYETFNQCSELATLYPIITGLSGAFGTQTISKSMANTRDELFKNNIYKEILVAILVGFFLSILLFFILSLCASINERKSFILSLTLIINLLVSSISGYLIPSVSHFLEIEPAILSGPLLSAFMDVFGMLVVILIANFVLL